VFVSTLMMALSGGNGWSKLLTFGPVVHRRPGFGRRISTIGISIKVSNQAQNYIPGHAILEFAGISGRNDSADCPRARAACPVMPETQARNPGQKPRPEAQARKNESKPMTPDLSRFGNRARRRLASTRDWLANLLATVRRAEPSFRSQRMCPYCGLITSRHKRCCLECGRALNPA
jgi:hypothetical protein